jgi:hypothetical protein
MKKRKRIVNEVCGGFWTEQALELTRISTQCHWHEWSAQDRTAAT